MKKTKLLLFIGIVLLFTSCNSDTIMDINTTIPKDGWSYETIPAFEFEIQDTTLFYQAFVNLQIIEDAFKYKNIYILVHLRDPDGVEVQNRVNLVLADNNGKWHGSGSSSLKSFKLPIATALKFPKTGRYTIGFEQNTRDSVLHAVNYVGLTLQKGEPIF